MEQIKGRICDLRAAWRRVCCRFLGPETVRPPFPGSGAYWEKRYAEGGNSGVGSYGFLAEFKAEILNAFVATHGVRTVIEFGCGDGNQLRFARYPAYVGYDVSRTAIAHCRKMFKSDDQKSFRLMDEYNGERADLTLSLDVLYHLVEDEVFESYMPALFGASDRYVIIYSSNHDDNTSHRCRHIRHRKFTMWIEDNMVGWDLTQHIPNRYPYQGDHARGSFADFFVFEKAGAAVS